MKYKLFASCSLWDLMIRLILAFIFILGGFLKIGSIYQFSDNIAAYQIVPSFLTNLVALTLPPLEIICGFSALSGVALRTGLLAILGLLVIFSSASLSAILRNLNVDCGCFVGLSWMDLSPTFALLRDVLLLSLSLFLYNRLPSEKII